jgi:N-acetylglucosaminyldiphosphoundecaprenol N-acetyl-beta-D-mannosaminyltransferase
MNARLAILDVWVDPVTMEQALTRVAEYVERGERPHAVFAVNPEKNFSVPSNPALYESFRTADLLIPDGIGVVLAARLLHRARLSRVPGVELMQEICRLAASRGYRVFLYGAHEEVSREAAQILSRRHPGLEIVGRANGFVEEADMPDLVRQINDSGAQILFLALGSPRQERWYTTYRDQLASVRVCQGIGGSLDAVTGHVNRAPRFFCRYHLEWFYRLVKEPSRIARQKVLPIFAFRVLKAKIKLLLGSDGRGGGNPQVPSQLGCKGSL